MMSMKRATAAFTLLIFSSALLACGGQSLTLPDGVGATGGDPSPRANEGAERARRERAEQAQTEAPGADSGAAGEQAIVFVERGPARPAPTPTATSAEEPAGVSGGARGRARGGQGGGEARGRSGQGAPTHAIDFEEDALEGELVIPRQANLEPRRGAPRPPAVIEAVEVDAASAEVVVEVDGDADVEVIVDEDDGRWTAWRVAYEAIGPVYTEPGELPVLRYKPVAALEQRTPDEMTSDVDLGVHAAQLALPLEHTHVDARLVGPVGRVFVSQQYTNPYEAPIEAVYVFALPENSAVDGMRLVVGERVIEGQVREREEARAIYEEARAAGRTAALLEQERPNVFTQSVANIAPGEDIHVDIRYVQDLTYDAGRYEFVFPMVVGPRYVPAGVDDGSRINPPVLGEGQRSGHDISLTVQADAGVAIGSFEVPTHEVDGGVDEDGVLTLALSRADAIPNRDFVLRYEVAGEVAQATVLSEWGEGEAEGYFTLLVQPPAVDVDALVGTREMLFVVDVSGSMRGVPLAMGKEAMVRALRSLRPVDTFNIITFASGTQRLFEAPRPASQRSVREAMAFVDRMEAGGGTEMLAGVREALLAPIEPGLQRVAVFVTDGYIGDEQQVIGVVGEGVDAAAAQNARARAFTIGVGSSVNRYLLDGVASEGDGTVHYALNREDPSRAVAGLFGVIDHPILTDVEVDFGALAVDGLYPQRTPDLFASRPLVVHGRYTASGEGRVVLRATRQGQPVALAFEVRLADEGEAAHDGVLGTLWARERVEQLERDLLYGAPYEQVREEVVDLGVRFGIATAYTSFVAVDGRRVVGDGDPVRVDQPVVLPEGVDRRGVGR